MVIAPHELAARAQAAFKSEFDSWVKKIDQGLLHPDTWDGIKPQIRLTFSDAPSTFVKHLLKAKYEEAGWKDTLFEVYSDQRDGPEYYITLVMPPQRAGKTSDFGYKT